LWHHFVCSEGPKDTIAGVVRAVGRVNEKQRNEWLFCDDLSRCGRDREQRKEATPCFDQRAWHALNSAVSWRQRSAAVSCLRVFMWQHRPYHCYSYS
jgi:hypothetical protein